MTIMDDPQLDLAIGEDGTSHALLLEQMRRSVAAMAGDAATPLRRVRLSLGAATVEVEWESRVSAEPQPLPVSATAPATAILQAPGEHTVTSPLVGTFYVTPEPGAAPFVKVGDPVVAGQQIGIVEAMKLMNPVEADRSGTVLRLLAGSGDAVEYEQPLLVIAVTDEQ